MTTFDARPVVGSAVVHAEHADGRVARRRWDDGSLDSDRAEIRRIRLPEDTGRRPVPGKVEAVDTRAKAGPTVTDAPHARRCRAAGTRAGRRVAKDPDDAYGVRATRARAPVDAVTVGTRRRRRAAEERDRAGDGVADFEPVDSHGRKDGIRIAAVRRTEIEYEVVRAAVACPRPVRAKRANDERRATTGGEDDAEP